MVLVNFLDFLETILVRVLSRKVSCKKHQGVSFKYMGKELTNEAYTKCHILSKVCFSFVS